MKEIKKQKNKKRKQILRRRIYMMTAGLFVLLAVAFARGHHSAGKEDDLSSKTKEVIQDKTQEEMYTSRLERVRAMAKNQGYPKGVIELLDKNEDTIDFVEDYGEKKDQAAAKNIGVKIQKGTIPELIQWDERWGYTKYGTSIVAVSGCGPTCMSMVVSGLTGNTKITPARTAAYSVRHNLIDEENNTYWEFMEKAAKHWGLNCYAGMLNKKQLKAELGKGHPVICSVGPGDFTKNRHFIVLSGWKDGKIQVNDPFSRQNSQKLWTYSRIKKQAKSMWVYSYSKKQVQER